MNILNAHRVQLRVEDRERPQGIDAAISRVRARLRGIIRAVIAQSFQQILVYVLVKSCEVERNWRAFSEVEVLLVIT